jgi:transposase InsO family protein
MIAWKGCSDMGTNKKQRRKFKADAVKLWRESGDTKTAVAQRLGIDSTALGNWIMQAGRIFTTRAQARTEIFTWIECWYNSRRLHSTLGYLTPLAWEQRQTQSARAA